MPQRRSLRFARPLRRLAVAAALLTASVAAACNDVGTTTPEAIPIEQQQWAAALQVNVSQFTRLTSGVYFLDSLVGTGTTLSGTPAVSVLYAGYLPNGTKFDERAGTPICFALNGLIPGWQVGMQGMKVGGKRRLLIPPEYGYGAGGNGPIPGNSNLLFNITLSGTGCTP
ncbi:MAG TPA: FKBP-type peptidyl-prolyl cis-trans isomerase [Gemmatimonadaceae bacterium]|nr:FKBP-type peptidyl-prolyl cis-trans isomerase [Gemmatimonadaceae bacterium]